MEVGALVLVGAWLGAWLGEAGGGGETDVTFFLCVCRTDHRGLYILF